MVAALPPRLLAAAVLVLVLCSGSLCFGWVQLTPPSGSPSPAAREGHSAVGFGSSLMIVFGGRTLVNSTLSAASTAASALNSSCAPIGGCNELSGAGLCAGCDNGSDATTSGCLCSCSAGYSGPQCQYSSQLSWLSDVAVLSLLSGDWAILEPDPPGTASPVSWPYSRYMHSAAVMGDAMLVYGGYSQLCGDYCSDLWQYNVTETDSAGRGRWTQIVALNASAPSPGRRWQHAACVYSDSLFVFGGMREGDYLSDMWSAAVQSAQVVWTAVLTASSASPSGRMGMASALDAASGLWFVYGGWSGGVDGGVGGFLSDLWSFAFNDSSWTLVQQPSDASEFPTPLLNAAAAMSAYMLFVYESVAAAQLRRCTAAAAAAALSSDAAAALCAAVSGYFDNEYWSTIWRYNSSSGYWTQQQIAATTLSLPVARSSHSVVYFPANTSFIMFGGWGSASAGGVTIAETYLSDAWQLDLSVCPNACNGRGLCSYGYCFCDDGFFGTDCQDIACQSSSCFYSALTLLQVCEHCNGNGNCSFASCLCSVGFATSSSGSSGSSDAASALSNGSTADCLSASCPRDCSGNGLCASDGSGGFACACDAGFYGLDCSLGYCSSDCNAPYGSCNSTDATCTCAANPLGLYTGPHCIAFLASAAARLAPALQLIALLTAATLALPL